MEKKTAVLRECYELRIKRVKHPYYEIPCISRNGLILLLSEIYTEAPPTISNEDWVRKTRTKWQLAPATRFSKMSLIVPSILVHTQNTFIQYLILCKFNCLTEFGRWSEFPVYLFKFWVHKTIFKKYENKTIRV